MAALKDLIVSGPARVLGPVYGDSFIKLNGTSSQFLKADGSVDTNSYATTASLGNYLPLAGGTMTGNITMGTNYFIYGINETYGSMIHFDGTRTVVGSVGTSTTAATLIRSKTGHAEVSAGSGTAYTIWDSGNDSGLVHTSGDETIGGLKKFTSDMQLYVASGETPALVFQRGDSTTLYDWKMFTDSSGLFKIAVSKNTSSFTSIISANADAGVYIQNVTNLTAPKFIKSGGTSDQFLKADGSVDSTAYATASSLSGYVKLNPGAAEQTIKSSIGTLSKGVINLWRNSGDHYTFLGFSNGSTETYLGGIGFKSQSDANLYRKSGANYYKIFDEGNSSINTTTNTISLGGTSLVTDKVKQVNSTLNVFGRLLITANNTAASSGSITNNTVGYAYYTDKIMANPSSGEVVASILRAKENDVYVGSASGSQCHQQYDATNKCLKFIFD